MNSSLITASPWQLRQAANILERIETLQKDLHRLLGSPSPADGAPSRSDLQPFDFSVSAFQRFSFSVFSTPLRPLSPKPDGKKPGPPTRPRFSAPRDVLELAAGSDYMSSPFYNSLASP